MTVGGAKADVPGIVIAPEDPAFYRDPDPACRWLHAHAPLYWHESGQFWIVSRWDDIRLVSRNPSSFSSAGGVLLPRRRPAAGGTRRAPNLQEMDPPVHSRYRQLVNRAFSPRMVASMEPRIRQVARRCLHRIPPGEVVDFVSHVAAPLPLLIIAEMLGIPPADLDHFKRWTDAIASSTNTDAAAGREMSRYFTDQLGRRRAHPREDLLSALLAAEVDGERLTDADIVRIVGFLLIAGNETTRNLISGGVRTLMQFPDQRTALLEDRSLLPGAVEEMLRWVTPVRWFARTATVDVGLGGAEIAAGDYLLLLYRAGNRDPDVWAEPYRFDVTRPNRGHVAFGHGEHLCLGAALARLEAIVLFDELLDHCPGLTPAGDPEVLPSALLNALQRLPVVFGSPLRR